VDGGSLYFESKVIVFGLPDGAIDLFGTSRLDPDEGALLVAYYPRSDALHR